MTILINVKPSAMMAGKTRADALSQLSGANIERIEVIGNPTSEYRAQGSGGIINIIMRTATKQGFNGSILANAGSAGRYNAGVNLNYGIRNLNFYGGYTFRCDRYDRTVDGYHISPSDTIFKRDEYVDSQTKETGGVVSVSYHRDRDADAKENMGAGSLQYTHCYGNSISDGSTL